MCHHRKNETSLIFCVINVTVTLMNCVDSSALVAFYNPQSCDSYTYIQYALSRGKNIIIIYSCDVIV